MRNVIAAVLLVSSVSSACDWVVGDPDYCAPGTVPNEALQRCVIPPACDGGTVNERNECVLVVSDEKAASTLDGGLRRASVGMSAGRGGMTASLGGRDGTGMVMGDTAGADDAGAADAALDGGERPGAPVCGNGIREGEELCDGDDCPVECPPNENKCVRAELVGSAATCDAQCQPTEITACAADDGCCPKGCNFGNDTDCSETCGDGVLSDRETCEPDSADDPCPAQTDCDDGNPCTMDTVTGSAESCSAECAHATITRMPVMCPDDGDPCTAEVPIESATSCTYECTTQPLSRSGGPAACPSDDPCKQGERVESTDACTYECTYRTLTRTGPSSCTSSDPCQQGRRVDSATSCTYECDFAAARAGTDCGGGRMCTSDGRCIAPAPQCGNGVREGDELCDGDCPTECPDDGNPCTREIASGSTATCNVQCLSESAPARTECGVDRVCRADGRCVSTRRQATCWEDGDCWEGSCIDNVCTEPCSTRADCSGSALCENGGCRFGCETSEVCAPGQYCLQVAGASFCRVAECRDTGDCPVGSECRSGLCG